MPDEQQKRYLYVAIDRATRWVYLEVRRSQSAKDAKAFMKRVEAKAPFKIQTVLTDNGKSFTDRFTRAGERKPSGRHPFDQECQAHGIEHRLIKPGRPQTNGMVERFNGRISDVLATRRYASSEDLEQTLKRYSWLYNHHVPQKALHHQSPITAMKEWQAKQPELFTKRVVNHTGPDSYVHTDIKHLLQMPDEQQKRDLYVAIDRATRWIYLEVRRSQSAKDARAFIKQVEEKDPFTIQTVLTDNGKSFTDRFTRASERKPSGRHPFDQECQAHGIEHCLIKPGRPQTNGMVERFNGCISDVLVTRCYASGEDQEQTLKRFAGLYDHHIPQKTFHHQALIAAMKEWQAKQPELFTK